MRSHVGIVSAPMASTRLPRGWEGGRGAPIMIAVDAQAIAITPDGTTALILNLISRTPYPAHRSRKQTSRNHGRHNRLPAHGMKTTAPRSQSAATVERTPRAPSVSSGWRATGPGGSVEVADRACRARPQRPVMPMSAYRRVSATSLSPCSPHGRGSPVGRTAAMSDKPVSGTPFRREQWGCGGARSWQVSWFFLSPR